SRHHLAGAGPLLTRLELVVVAQTGEPAAVHRDQLPQPVAIVDPGLVGPGRERLNERLLARANEKLPVALIRQVLKRNVHGDRAHHFAPALDQLELAELPAFFERAAEGQRLPARLAGFVQRPEPD